jgi:hypothetical protein
MEDTSSEINYSEKVVGVSHYHSKGRTVRSSALLTLPKWFLL